MSHEPDLTDLTGHADEDREPGTPGFLRRWSSRKAGAGRELPSSASGVSAETGGVSGVAGVDDVSGMSEFPAAPVADTLNQTSGAVSGNPVASDAPAATPADETPLLSDADMPPIGSLTADSDLRNFFNRGVSKALRQAALAHVFRLPAYNVRDGLNEYDGDYTRFEPLGDTITADMRFHALRKAREREEQRAAAEASGEAEAMNEPGPEAEAVNAAEPPPLDDPATATDLEPVDDRATATEQEPEEDPATTDPVRDDPAALHSLNHRTDPT